MEPEVEENDGLYLREEAVKGRRKGHVVCPLEHAVL